MPQNQKVYEMLRDRCLSFPQCQALGLQFESMIERKQILSVPWREQLVGNKATGVIHGGVITTLIDTTSAVAVFAQLPDFEKIATLDLRVDYLHPATVGEKIYARGECYRLTEHIAFVRTICYQTDPSDAIAHGVSTFIRTPISAEIKGALA
jgi:uncharacterized protein (TIGR00369 family)